MPRVEGTCAQCGKTFKYYPSAQQGITCSRSCSMKYQPRKPRRGETLPCEACGKPVYLYQSARIGGQGRFCSRACWNKVQTKTPVIKTCALDGCDKELRLKPSQSARQYCSKAHDALARIKRPQDRVYNGRPTKRDKAGYLMVWEPTHPNKTMKGWQYEHRLIAEAAFGRYLRSDEQVDHIDRDKTNNDPSNLQVLSQIDHARKSAGEFRSDIDQMKAELEAYRQRFGPLPEQE